MQDRLFIHLFSLFLLACNTSPNTDLEEIKTELAQLHAKMDSLKVTQIDTVIKIDTVLILPKAFGTKTLPKSQTQPKPQPQPKHQHQPKPSLPNDTIFYYYSNGKISGKFHPWKDEERLLELFDLYGVKTFEATEIRKSYSVGLRLSFHPNGSVSKIEESSNPGASLYTYQAVMKFSTTNNPEVRTESRTPMYSIEEMMTKGRPYFWNKKEFRWVQQEIVVETNTPPGG